MGGISRVIKIWKTEKILKEHNIKYISTVSNSTYFQKLIDLLRSLIKFILFSSKNCKGIYIHTASRRSLYRKLIFIIISSFFSKKIILHIHPSYFYTFIMNFKGLKKRFILYFLNKIDCYVVLTHEMKENIIKLFPQKKVFVIRNPINFELMENKYNIARDNNRLLFLGWYLKIKGVFDLIDAVQILTKEGCDVKLDLYGTYNINRLKNYVKQKEILDRVNVNGWIGDKEKLKALYNSTALILPSYSEGIPNVIIEAMATKTPIIATAVGGLKEILIDRYNALIVKPKNPNDLSKKILEALKNKQLREKISCNAYNFAKTQFDIKKIEKEIKQIIYNEF